MTAPGNRRLVITIDGPAGAGKSTAAKRLASRLGYRYLDTGALYRAVAWKGLTSGIDCGNQEAITHLLDSTKIQVHWGSEMSMTITVDSREVGAQLRSPEVTRLASTVAALPAVREWLLILLAPNRFPAETPDLLWR